MKNWFHCINLFLLFILIACSDNQKVKNDILSDKNIDYKIEEFTDGKNKLRLKGWVNVEGKRDVYIVLNHQNQKQTFPVLYENRTDLAEQFGKSYLNSGFTFAINKNYLEAGTYDIELIIKQGNSRIEKDTGLSVQVDKTSIEPFKTGTEWIESYHLGDSKLINVENDIITFTTNGHLLYKKNNEDLKELSPAISANWFAIEKVGKEKAIVITGSFEKNKIEVHEVNLISGKSKMLSVIDQGGNLKIDPALLVSKNGYYATFADINGNINNGDSANENGLYSIKLYYSSDLKTWSYVQTIVSEKKNIEDGGLYLDKENNMHFLYEEEEIDRGHSSINIVSSGDMGKSWSDSKEVLSNIADHEPASLMSLEDGNYYFFYSSDLDNQGIGSYNYASMKYAVLDSNFQVIRKDLNLDTEIGASLYDVLMKEDKIYLLYANDYDTDDQLVLININNQLQR